MIYADEECGLKSADQGYKETIKQSQTKLKGKTPDTGRMNTVLILEWCVLSGFAYKIIS